MSRTFVREQDIEALEELPNRHISPYPNDVTDEGLKQLELMLEAARDAPGELSHASPLARALMGKSLGDVAGLGTTEVEILAIR